MKREYLLLSTLLAVSLFLADISTFSNQEQARLSHSTNSVLWRGEGGIMLPLSQPLIIAHRGASKLAPENTLPAFKKALDFNSDFIELDYHTTKDGKMVVIHGDYLDSTTDAEKKFGHSKIAVNSKTLKEIQSLDAGKWKESKFKGARIPTLKEAMAVIQKTSFTLIERKEGKPKDLFLFLKKEGWITNVIVQSFDWNFIKQLGEYSNAISKSAIGPPEKYKGQILTKKEQWLNKEFIEYIASLDAQFITWNNQITAISIALAHEKGLRVFIWTIDDPDEAERLVKLGVDGIITNDVESIAKRLRK
jgi:glycerophosphoryl diester phosphodiesterase